jgi:hypothetical protein
MPLNDKVCLVPNGHKLISGETDIDIDDAMALGAGQMVVVLAAATDTVVMGPVGKLDPGEQSHIHQLFHPTVDRGSAYPWLGLPEFLPEVLHSEIRTEAFKLDQSVRNEFAWTRVALAHLVESRVNCMRYHLHFLLFATQPLRTSDTASQF